MTTSPWNGSPLKLNPRDTATIPNTVNGPMVFGYANLSTQGSAGELTYTSGGSTPQRLPAPALVNQLSILTGDWGGNNLTITNSSPPALQPVTIYVQAFGAGLAGTSPVTLNLGTPMPLVQGVSAKGTAQARFMTLTFTASSSDLAIFAFQGGPASPTTGSNIYVVALNSPAGDTGGTGQPAAPAGYTATSGGNTYTYQFNWGSVAVYVVNLSPYSGVPNPTSVVRVTLAPV